MPFIFLNRFSQSNDNQKNILPVKRLSVTEKTREKKKRFMNPESTASFAPAW